MAEQYMVDGNLIHDQEQYRTGDMIMLEEEQAQPLLAIGRVKPAPQDIASPQEPAAPTVTDGSDGFPIREPSAPAVNDAASPAPAPSQPVTPTTPPQMPAAPAVPKQPTEEQIAKDMEQLG